jgi:two-component system phosphate regulon sensor histidine kinase PhoR
VILANSETLLSGALDDGPRAQKFVEAVHRNAERLSRLIADLLELSKIEAGKVVFTRVPVNVRDAVDHVVDAVEPRAREKQMHVAVDVDADLAVEGDPRALDQVLINLVDNAVKYTPPGGHVTVSAHRDGGDAVVVVADDGPGVDETHKGRLFERFYRVDPGRSRDVGGTGLGLAIVKHLVEAMGGRVRVEDARPHGTRFCVTLPAVGAAEATPRDRAA